MEGVAIFGFAFGYSCDEVGAAQPVGFSEVGGGPLGGVVGVGVVEADDVVLVAAGFALDFDELGGVDVVAVVGGIETGVAGGDDAVDFVGVGEGVAEEDAAALVGVGLLAVGAELGVVGEGDAEHGWSFEGWRVRVFGEGDNGLRATTTTTARG